ncbi:MAG TPA: TetR/AcrR family transcriptional regulator C-terminal domain-containing protein [Stackebrandtia sp.]|uniref:TetR/AcrR family transcriptional regulator C-terminal domain-containing protein n=1 Tax=Stackebrandtia sp. TaxID=2023065 RepID=UPI002D3CC185|nr:TetR/AcrR family transcriptional regulator C-terminal domain-containing protein [Stackebrandtia sp.]HZE37418.1 TetR/AcrR family transcriptional regulator C-terminal domain-containing protein [Stackebrandtia sp.]
MTTTPSCLVCGKPLNAPGRGRPPRYCSHACRARAYRARVAAGADDRRHGDVREVPLSTKGVVDAAIALADQDGVGGLSMRRVAAELGVGVMSLYGQVRGRDELLELMMDKVFGENRPPEGPPGDWRSALELSARQEWEVYLRHDWAAPLAAFTRPPIAPNLMAHGEWRMRALDGHGLPFDTLPQVSAMLSNMTLSAAFARSREREAERRSGITRLEWFASRAKDIAAAFASHDLPLTSRFDERTFEASQPEAMFEFGLKTLLDGVAALIEDNGSGA